MELFVAWWRHDIDRLVKERRNSRALAMELRLSCINPSMWKRFPRHWPFVRGVRRSSVDSLHKGPVKRALMYSLMIVGDLRHRTWRSCDVTLMGQSVLFPGTVFCVRNVSWLKKWEKQAQWCHRWFIYCLAVISHKALPKPMSTHHHYVYISRMIFDGNSDKILCFSQENALDRRFCGTNKMI